MKYDNILPGKYYFGVEINTPDCGKFSDSGTEGRIWMHFLHEMPRA